MSAPIKVGDSVTMFSRCSDGVSHLEKSRVCKIGEHYIVVELHFAHDIKGSLTTRSMAKHMEGVHWVRGHVTKRHKAGRAMLAAQALLL